MKRRLFLMAVISIMGLSFIGCSSSDSNDPTDSVKIDKKIVGRWERVAFYIAENDFWDYSVTNFYYQFNADGTYKTDASAKTSGTYTFNGSTLVLDGGFGENVKFSENNTLMEWGKWRYQKK